jgi:pimeloyl-ACP methyl ester carboxylesterase
VKDWSDGTDLAYLRELVTYWRGSYDWRAQEARLNAFPQFTARIGERDIHFVHVRGKGTNPVPLVITHGWPGSFIEMLDLIPRLTDPERFGGDPADAFDVVVPSLPGYGFSSRPAHPGTTPQAIADTWVALMIALGYDRFGAQGGDWGAAVSTHLGMDHAQRLIGVQLNFLMRGYLPSQRSVTLSLSKGAPRVRTRARAYPIDARSRSPAKPALHARGPASYRGPRRSDGVRRPRLVAGPVQCGRPARPRRVPLAPAP